MADNRFLGSISSSAIPRLILKSILSKNKKRSRNVKTKFNKENIALLDPNIQISDRNLLPLGWIPPKPLLELVNSPAKELISSDIQPQLPETLEHPIKVVVRIRPVHDPTTGGRLVARASKDSVSIGDRDFTFDSILDSNSTQEDVFQSVGVLMVKDALAGYNTSLLAYGQTGSGKTYTMWGPPSAMVDFPSTNGLQGVVPRIFQMLFSNIQNEVETSRDKQINYQFRCSFVEIFNEHIRDLLDPTPRELKIKDDAKNGVYVENMLEEYVSTYEDVTRLLIKGLSSRKVGATGINMKSSRSHIVFTCIIESWCKGFSGLKTSRITLVDLAGFERNILEDAGIQCAKEGKYVKKSTSQLGHVVNILTGHSDSRIRENVPYNSSCLTHLLRESLGGNAKLSVICTVSQDDKHMSDTISTLRFGKMVKQMPNDPIINEITEDDVNGLSDQIRLLKEELIRAISNVSSDSYLKGQSTRESLNQLRVSLNRSLMLPHIVNDYEDEIHIDEDDIKELEVQIRNVHNSYENSETFVSEGCIKFCSAEGCETECYMSCSEESENEEISSGHTSTVFHPDGISINTNHCCPALQDPVLDESPTIRNTSKKSSILSPNSSSIGNAAQEVFTSSWTSQAAPQEEYKAHPEVRSSRVSPEPAESLAASLRRGLQIIDYHQQHSASTRLSVSSFSFDHNARKPRLSTDEAKTLAQESSEREQSSDTVSVHFLCSNCGRDGSTPSNEIQDSLNTRIASGDRYSANREAYQEPKDFEKYLLQALERQKKLESVCKDQEEKIKQLNQMVSEHSCESLDHKESNLINDREKLLGQTGNDEGHEQDFINEKCEIKEIQGLQGCNGDSNKCFDMVEREALLKEIVDLRSKLQLNTDAHMIKSSDKVRSSLLQSIQLRKSGIHDTVLSEEEFEEERQRWVEMEGNWISLTDELRIDLESNRQRADKMEMELKLEKKCKEELDDALKRAVYGHAKMVEHYAELQEKHNDLIERHRSVTQGIQGIKMAAAKAGSKGCGGRFAKSLAAELSALRLQRQRERDLLKKENISLKCQLRDTAEAVHAAGELLVRLRESQEAVSFSEEKLTKVQEENDKLKKLIEKLKSKHKMEMSAMKQYLGESRLPEAALRALHREDSDVTQSYGAPHSGYDDQPWRAEFCDIYQGQYY